MTIKFFDFENEQKLYKDAVIKSVFDTINNGLYILGPKLTQFEQSFAKYVGTKYCLGVGNGLDAIKIILMAVGINQNSEVIVPAHTFIASWLPVTALGATIIPIEPHPNSFNIDISQIESKITSKTKAILAVHLYGNPVDMRGLLMLSKKYDIPVIEDAAQAHGARDNLNHKCGSSSLASAFSFYPTKNLGAFGDAGAITTNDGVLYKKNEEHQKLWIC